VVMETSESETVSKEELLYLMVAEELEVRRWKIGKYNFSAHSFANVSKPKNGQIIKDMIKTFNNYHL
jgi:hypothetical protein